MERLFGCLAISADTVTKPKEHSILSYLVTLTPFQKLPKNVGDLGKLLLPKALKSCPKSKTSPNLVTLPPVLLTWWKQGLHFFEKS